MELNVERASPDTERRSRKKERSHNLPSHLRDTTSAHLPSYVLWRALFCHHPPQEQNSSRTYRFSNICHVFTMNKSGLKSAALVALESAAGSASALSYNPYVWEVHFSFFPRFIPRTESYSIDRRCSCTVHGCCFAVGTTSTVYGSVSQVV